MSDLNSLLDDVESLLNFDPPPQRKTNTTFNADFDNEFNALINDFDLPKEKKTVVKKLQSEHTKSSKGESLDDLLNDMLNFGDEVKGESSEEDSELDALLGEIDSIAKKNVGRVPGKDLIDDIDSMLNFDVPKREVVMAEVEVAKSGLDKEFDDLLAGLDEESVSDVDEEPIMVSIDLDALKAPVIVNQNDAIDFNGNVDELMVDMKQRKINDRDYVDHSSDSLDIAGQFDLDAPLDISLTDFEGELFVSAGKSVSLNFELPAEVEHEANPIGVYENSELDRVINSIRERVKHIVVTFGDCDFCQIPILNQSCNAFGRTWHIEHFYCDKCGNVIDSDQFVEDNGKPWCTDCFSKIKGGVCGFCNEVINGQILNALGKKWHPDHFVCGVCHEGFPDGKFFDKDGVPYCEKDYRAKFLNCKSCGKVIEEKAIEALDGIWHPEHFACQTCWKPFGPGFFQWKGYPYCSAHYQQKVNEQAQNL